MIFRVRFSTSFVSPILVSPMQAEVPGIQSREVKTVHLPRYRARYKTLQLKGLNYKSLYVIPRDDFVHSVLIASFRLSVSVDCMFGFFGSEALRSISPGLAEYLVRGNSPMRMIVSPYISTKMLQPYEKESAHRVKYLRLGYGSYWARLK